MKTEPNKVPGWIYSYSDYRQMFDLREQDLNKKILDFPGGISSFNAECYQSGIHITSGDASYQYTPAEMKTYAKKRFDLNETYLQEHLQNLRSQDEVFIQNILSTWKQSLENFIHDYEKGLEEKRYIPMSLPKLPYEDHAFDLVLCKDLLFHSKSFLEFNREQIVSELCRVGEEVRVFPLLDEKGSMTDELGPIMLLLQQNNFGVEVREVPYQMRKGGNAMLRIWAKECIVEE